MKKYFLIGLVSFIAFACCFLFMLSYIIDNDKKIENEILGENDALKSFEWWYAQRALPNDFIPIGAYQRAVHYTKSNLRNRTTSSIQPWTSLGPYNVGGRTLALAINPTNPNIVWAGSASGGLWKSNIGGVGEGAWTYINTGYSTLSVSAIALDPLNPNTIYIGTGEISYYHRPLIGTMGARASYGMGVLKSTNAGITWTQTPLQWTFPQITAVQKIIINPINSQTIFAATSEGVYKSNDAGNSWAISNNVLMAMDIVMSPNDTSTIFSSHGNLNSSPNPGIYKTTNAGVSWLQLTNGLPSANFGRTALSISQSNPSIIYAGISDGGSGGMIGLYKSMNSGTNWTRVSTFNYVNAQGWYDNVIAVHPKNPDSIYCAGFDIYLSTDSGKTVNDISGYVVHVDHHAIAFHPTDPNTVYFGTDGGVFKTTNGGASFLDCNYGYQTTQFYPGFANATDDSTISIGGLQDNGTLKYSGNKYWSNILGADGGWCIIDPTNKNVMYYQTQFLNVYKSIDGGITVAGSMTGLANGSSNTNFIAPIAIAPSSPNILYAGSHNVYKTTNGGALWFSSNGQLTLNGTHIACIGVSRTNPDLVIAGTGTGEFGVIPKFEIFVTDNGGIAWNNITYKLNGVDSLPNRYPTDIEFDPTNDAIVYLTYSGYGTGHVFKSTSGGGSWTDISGNLPDIPHQSICIDPETPENIYVGTDLGIFHSSTGGNTWEEFNDGMPPAMVLDLTISKSNGKLRASTFGSGVYERPLVRIPSIALLAPQGGEIWSGDYPATILWTQKFLSHVKLEYSTDNGTDWNLIADSIPASQNSYSWMPPLVSTTEARIRISSIENILVRDSSALPFTIVINPVYYSGWNLISLPLKPIDTRTSIIFPTATSKAFGYTTMYSIQESLKIGYGYWLKFDTPQFISFTGDSITSDTIDVRNGWNMIGSISCPVPTTNIIQIPNNIVTSRYYGYKAAYIATDTILPRWGYWVKTNSIGKLIINKPTTLSKNLLDKQYDLAKLNSISFRDRDGKIQTLYFGKYNYEINLDRYELPPLPPDGIFDVRFATQNIIELFPENIDSVMTIPIEIQSLSNSLTVNWKLTDDNYKYSLILPFGKVVPISGINSTHLERNKSSLFLQVSSIKNHTNYSGYQLYQNYPNPFNPSTTIVYELPRESHVTLKLYDILGKEVMNLIDEQKTSGRYNYELNVSNTKLSSGIYVYRLTANELVFSKKLLLLK